MYEERLLERIGNLERDPADIRKTNISRAIGSVIEHLQRLLNTRQGNVPTAEDYGIPDLSNFPEKEMTIIRQP